MSLKNHNEENSLIPASQQNHSKDVPSHHNDWMKLQQMGQPSDKRFATQPEPNQSKGHRQNEPPKNVTAGSSGWGCILVALGFILLAILAGVTHDTSYRDKLTPTGKYFDDLRNEQEAAENSFR